MPAYVPITSTIQWPDTSRLDFSGLSTGFMQGRQMAQQKEQFAQQQAMQEKKLAWEQEQYKAQIEAAKAEKEAKAQAVREQLASQIQVARMNKAQNAHRAFQEGAIDQQTFESTYGQERNEYFKDLKRLGIDFTKNPKPELDFPLLGPDPVVGGGHAVQGDAPLPKQGILPQLGEAMRPRVGQYADNEQKRDAERELIAAQHVVKRTGIPEYSDPRFAEQTGELWQEGLALAEKELAGKAPKSIVNVGMPTGKQEPTEPVLGEIQKAIKGIDLYMPQMEEMSKVDKDLLTYYSAGKETAGSILEKMGLETKWGTDIQNKRQDLRTAVVRTAATLLYGEAGKQLSDPERAWMMSALPDIESMSGTQFQAAAKRIMANAKIVRQALATMAGEGFDVGKTAANPPDIKPARQVAGAPVTPGATTPQPSAPSRIEAMSDEELDARINALRGAGGQ